LILVAYRHGLRVAEIVAFRWDQVSFETGLLHVTRAKKGEASTHPIGARELRALRQLKREQAPASPFMFTTERGGPMSPAGVRKLVARIGEASKLPFPFHPHMLRHGCGFALAAQGRDTRAIQAYLGHRSIQHTVRYTALAPGRFKDFWRD
jgi:type 1 fimbriae regulatory protein FimB/type 1 fimbriae regulatory protein FimE